MELYKAQILLERYQYEALAQIAQEQGRSLSEIGREMIDHGLRYYLRRQVMLVTRERQGEYTTDPMPTELTTLDKDDFLFEDDKNEKG